MSPTPRTRCPTAISRSSPPTPAAAVGTTWLVEDQRFVRKRPDVLTWQTAPLTENLTVTGDMVAHLFASTTGTDSDWIVKLIDVYPEDYPADRGAGWV